jgi:predicted NBD/HSP70 family sugar kinase
MKLSQPQSARSINNYRVLNLVRTSRGLSKAELSRMLKLNKVSTGEIVDGLIGQGVLREAGKLESSNGRRATALELVNDSRFAIAVDIGPKFTVVSLIDLALNVVKFERIPTENRRTAEDFCVSLIKSCMRTMKLVREGCVIGMAVSVSGSVSDDGQVIQRCPFLPWMDIPLAEVIRKALGIEAVIVNSLEALVLAENMESSSGGCVFYVDWGERIDGALVKDRKVFCLNEAFGHLKVSRTGLCTCGQIGCLESVASTWALGQSADVSLKDLWDKVNLEPALEGMAAALALASQVCGFSNVVIGGQGGTIPDVQLEKLVRYFRKYRHPYSPEAEVTRSGLGDKADIMATAEYALDHFFFHSGFLIGVEELL